LDAISIPVDLTNQPRTVLLPSVTGGAGHSEAGRRRVRNSSEKARRRLNQPHHGNRIFIVIVD